MSSKNGVNMLGKPKESKELIRQKALEWVYQQSRNFTKETAIAYIAGFTDGDGCISIVKKGKYRTPNIHWSGMSFVQYETMYQMMKVLNFGCYMRVQKEVKNSWCKHPIYHIQTDGFKRCKRILEAITPYLIEKKQEALLTLKFINERMKKYGLPKYPITQEENSLIERIWSLKRERHLTDYKLHIKFDDDIVGTDRKLSESAEMTDRLK